MKKLLILILPFILLSCTETDVIVSTKQYPFVVRQIVKFDDGSVKYYKYSTSKNYDNQVIYSDVDLGYVIGDTVNFKPHK